MEAIVNDSDLGYVGVYTYRSDGSEETLYHTDSIKNGWHHIACTYDGSTQKLYVDGNLSASRTFSATIGAGIALGTNFTSSGSIGRDTKMTGYLTSCRVYNRVLTDSEITELSNEFSEGGSTGSLDTILSALDGARDTLVTAINAKGGSLADNATLYQCADEVGNLSGGGSAEYYKCASVDTSAKTWTGYKAVFDSAAGTWSFESGVTEGLTYTSVTPVVGVIYTKDALVTVASVYTGFYATSSPLNPGSNTSGVWEITASSFLDTGRNAYKAFDESLNSNNGCWHSQSGMPQWLQWRNTESKVLVKSYFLQNRSGGTGGYYPVEWTLSGSDDGEDWTELDNVVIQNSDTASGSKTTRNLASNNTAYYYHRITITKAYNNGYATIGFLQAFNYLQE